MNFIEKRKHPRVELDSVTVEIYSSTTHMTDPEISDICTVINLSENGMRFESNSRYNQAILLRLTFLLPESMVIIRTDAIVVNSLQTANKFETGVQFKNLGIAEHKILQHFIDKMLAA